MNVNNIQQYNTNFGGIPLYKATLATKSVFSKKVSPVKAFVSVIEKSDLDRPALSHAKWDKTNYGGEILDEIGLVVSGYLKGNTMRYLLVDVPKASPKEQVKAMAMYYVGSDNINLQLLQSENQLKWFKKTKGAGSMIIYALTKIAEKLGKKSIKVDADKAAYKFYEKMGMKISETDVSYRDYGRYYVLPKRMFRDIQKKIEEKFGVVPAGENIQTI